MKCRYDPNPDVNEVLRYSGAGKAAVAREWSRTNELLRRAGDECSVRRQARLQEYERKERRSLQCDMWIATGVILLVGIAPIIFALMMGVRR